MSSTLLKAPVATALLISVLPAGAFAASTLVQTREVGTQVSHCCWDNWLNIQTDSGPNAFYQVNSWGQAWATMEGQAAQYGLLGGKASAGSQMPDVGYNGSGGAARLRDAWSDDFTIGSATLAAGTPVQLRLTVTIDGAIRAMDPDGVQNSAEGAARLVAAFHYGGWDAPWITGVDVLRGGYMGGNHGYGDFDVAASNTTIINATVGQVLNLVGDMGISYGQANGPDARAWYSGSAEGNARFFVDMLTPEAGYTTASGASYATPIAGTWSLFLAGLGMAGAFFRRRA